jgi:hypothetical protein
MKITMKSKSTTKRALVALILSCFVLPQTLWAQGSVEEKPNAGKMAGDLVVARPIGLVMTVAGTAAFIVSLPFTLLAGNVSEAADSLMIGPAETTFMRCLGCTSTGYSYKDIEKNKKKEVAANDE